MTWPSLGPGVGAGFKPTTGQSLAPPTGTPPPPLCQPPSQLPPVSLSTPHGKELVSKCHTPLTLGQKFLQGRVCGTEALPGGEPAGDRLGGSCLPRSHLLVSDGDFLSCCGWVWAERWGQRRGDTGLCGQVTGLGYQTLGSGSLKAPEAFGTTAKLLTTTHCLPQILATQQTPIHPSKL